MTIVSIKTRDKPSEIKYVLQQVETTEPKIFDQPLQKITGNSRVLSGISGLFIAVSLLVTAKGGGGWLTWALLIPAGVFALLSFFARTKAKARLVITRSVKGELHLIVHAKNLMLQGTPSSYYNWTYTKHGFMQSSVYQHCIELKTTRGEKVGLISKREYTDSGGLEVRTHGLDGEYPKFLIADINPLIDVSEQNGIVFSYK